MKLFARKNCRTSGARAISSRKAKTRLKRSKIAGNVICRQAARERRKDLFFVSLEDEKPVFQMRLSILNFVRNRFPGLLITEEDFLVIEGEVQNSEKHSP